MMFLSNRVALGRRALTQTVLSGARCSLIMPQPRMLFSEDASAPEKPAAPEPTAAEVAANREEWGIKYDDECLKFEKEWQEIAEAVEKENMAYIESELSDLQKKKVEMLCDKVIDMNMFEQRYFHAVLAQRVQRVTGLSLMKLNLDWPSLKQDGAGTWPPANPNWFKQ